MRGYNIGHVAPLGTQICRSSGYWPIRAPQSKARQIAANTKPGYETRAIREERSAKPAELYELEMLGREMGRINGDIVVRGSSRR
jgi:hypothetical protein